MKDRAEDTTGGNARLAERPKELAAAARGKIEVLQPLTVKLPPIVLPAGKAVLRASG